LAAANTLAYYDLKRFIVQTPGGSIHKILYDISLSTRYISEQRSQLLEVKLLLS
jgi:hypothetical protein